MPKIKDEHTDIVFARIDEVVTTILSNDRYMQSKRGTELAKLVMEKFAVSERVAYRYISEAKKEVRKLGRENAEKVKESIIRRLEYQYQKTKDADRRLALDILKYTGEITPGVVPDKKVKNENVNYDFDPDKFTEKGLERLAKGDEIKDVLLDPESIKIEK